MSNNNKISNVLIAAGTSIIAGSAIYNYIKNRSKKRRIEEIERQISDAAFKAVMIKIQAYYVNLDPRGTTEEMQELYRQSKYLEAHAAELAEEKQNLRNR